MAFKTTSYQNNFNNNYINSNSNSDLPEFILPYAEIDREYCTFPNVFKGNDTDEGRITLILHGTFDKIQRAIIDKHIHNWQAPVSISVVFPRYSSPSSGIVQCVYKIVKKAFNEDNLISNYLSVHFIIPKADICQPIMADPLPSDEQCESLKEQEKQLLEHLNPNVKIEREVMNMAEYPINFARNFARKQATTKYILIADFDHMFSEKFESKMRELADRTLTKDSKKVLVYRIFEIDEKANWPKTKNDLKNLISKKAAMEFHGNFSVAHKIPHFSRWLEHEEDENSTEIQYYHKFMKFEWEPQFVSRTDIPFHDETFGYPLRDNTVLRWELCRAGYRFAVVYDVFMFHPGIKSIEYRRKHDRVRGKIVKYKWKTLDDFRIRMNQTYPKTYWKCPKFFF